MSIKEKKNTNNEFQFTGLFYIMYLVGLFCSCISEKHCFINKQIEQFHQHQSNYMKNIRDRLKKESTFGPPVCRYLHLKKLELTINKITKFIVFEWDLRSNYTYIIFSSNRNSIAGWMLSL